MNTNAELTAREKEISELIAWGPSKKEIASLLFISERTVENHVRNIYEKVECQKANELSAWWFCTHFQISFQLSPIAQKIIAGCMLILFIYGEIQETSFITLRGSRTRVRTERSFRRNRSEDCEDIAIAI